MKTTVDRGQGMAETTRRGSAFLLARPAVMLRVEGAAMFAGSVLLYWLGDAGWWLFALLLLVPDVSMLGYLAGRGVGAAAYNVSHAYPLPAVVAGLGLLAGAPLAVAVAFVWFAHISMDRARLRVQVPVGLQGHPYGSGVRFARVA